MESIKEKKKPGRPRKNVAVKELASQKKNDAKKAALTAKQERDLALLRITKKENPFRFSVKKRKDTWLTVASAMIKAYPEDETDDRRCRERITKLMEKHRMQSLKLITGSGTTEPTELDSLLDFLVNQDELSANNQEEEKEKEDKSRRLTEKIQRDACETFSSIAVSKDIHDDQDDDTWPQDRQSPETSTNKRHKVSKKPSSPPKYKRRKVADPMFEYLEGKKAQATKDAEVRMEIHRDMMRDNEAERLIKREQLMLDRERLLLEATEKERTFTLLTNAFQTSKNHTG